MCSRIFLNKPKRFEVFQNFKNKIGTFPLNLKTLKQNQNVMVCSRIFKNKSGTFPFDLKTLEQNQNVLMCSRVFLNSFSSRFSYNLYWPFLGLCYTLTASSDILRDLFKPLTASKTSQCLYRHSHGLY
jgi:hypothetical protein